MGGSALAQVFDQLGNATPMFAMPGFTEAISTLWGSYRKLALSSLNMTGQIAASS